MEWVCKHCGYTKRQRGLMSVAYFDRAMKYVSHQAPSCCALPAKAEGA